MDTELAACQSAIERAKVEIAALHAELADTAQDAARLQVALERLRRLVRVAVARGFIHQELREEIER